MGTISLGLKRKLNTKNTLTTHTWGCEGSRTAFVAINLNDETTVIETVENYCGKYTDELKRKSELEMYKQEKCKYVLETRNFAFGKTRLQAIRNLTI